MAMNMRRAFNAKFLVSMEKYPKPSGSYNAYNEWESDPVVAEPIKGRLLSGNRFSQFDVGEALQNEDGGARLSDFKSLYIADHYSMEVGAKVGYKGKFYNVIQKSPEEHFGFSSFLLEKSKNWEPQ